MQCGVVCDRDFRLFEYTVAGSVEFFSTIVSDVSVRIDFDLTAPLRFYVVLSGAQPRS